MIERKIVRKFGNGGHIVLPKEYVGKRIRFMAEPKSFEDIKSEVLEILNPYLGNILGIYLYGSFARNEQTIDSDIDILAITSDKLKILDKIQGYSIVSATIKEIEKTLENNAVLILPIIKEGKTIVNPELLRKYDIINFNKKNTKRFIDSSIRVLKLNEKGLELDFEIGSLVYSLMLRIRGLLMIKFMLKNKSYSKALLFDYLDNNNFPKGKIKELYRIYSSERDNIKVKESNIITKKDIKILLTIANRLMEDIKRSLK